MARHEHEVRVEVGYGSEAVFLRCRCGWTSDYQYTPTVSALALMAQDHRRAARMHG